MTESFFAIMAAYVISAVWVHRRFSRSLALGEKARHYVLVTKNNQSQIEWIIRSLLFYSWLRGVWIKITILDQCSSDDTMRIVNRLAACRYMPVKIVESGSSIDACLHSSEYSAEEVILVELNKREDLKKLPLLQ
ncbi:MAG TPA: hypothetical protein VF260_03260 [Bacilli bacterium]